MAPQVFTVGHSTQEMYSFIALLRRHGLWAFTGGRLEDLVLAGHLDPGTEIVGGDDEPTFVGAITDDDEPIPLAAIRSAARAR